jgi:ATP-binding cassette subfamily F protein 3
MLTSLSIDYMYVMYSELDGATASQSGNRREAKLEASGTNKSRDIRIENFDLAYGER